jgi:CRP-like cAMP-binding protein
MPQCQPNGLPPISRTGGSGGRAKTTIGQRVALARQSPLFSAVSQADFTTILSNAHETWFSRREKIFFEHDPITQVVLLTAGCVKETRLGDNGGEAILRVYGPGELVGPLCRSGEGHCSAAQAIQASHALLWTSENFEDLAKRFPVLWGNILRILDNRLEELGERFREISTDNVASRVSSELLRLVNRIGQQVNGYFQISLTREELAQLTGTSLFRCHVYCRSGNSRASLPPYVNRCWSGAFRRS